MQKMTLANTADSLIPRLVNKQKKNRSPMEADFWSTSHPAGNTVCRYAMASTAETTPVVMYAIMAKMAAMDATCLEVQLSRILYVPPLTGSACLQGMNMSMK